MAQMLDGKIARDSYAKALSERSLRLSARPTLVIIQVGDNKESDIYIEQKKRFAKAVGAVVEHAKFPANVPARTIEDAISSYNRRADIDGIIIQLPLPASLDKQALIEKIDPSKDVDGLTNENQDLLAAGVPRMIPATAKGVLALLDFYKIGVKGAKAVVFGRSRLVGGPIASLLRARGADVSVCSSQTPNPRALSAQADLVVVAIGRPQLIDASYIKPGAVIVDVGINSVPGERPSVAGRTVVGDVNHASVAPFASAISPVPGGVGPMTVLSLFDNLIVSAEAKGAVN